MMINEGVKHFVGFYPYWPAAIMCVTDRSHSLRQGWWGILQVCSFSYQSVLMFLFYL